MNRKVLLLKLWAFCSVTFLFLQSASAQIIISQYYEGTGTNKWIELTNTGNTAINTASPQLKLGLWAVTGSTGNIAFTGAASATMNLTVVIPAYGSVLIGNTGNGTEISYLTAASAAQTGNSVINFNGNDGVALLDASNNIIDQFGNGINATDISYVRNTSITSPSATYTSSQWSSASIATVQSAGTTDPTRLNYQLASLCSAPGSQATGLTFGSPTSTSNTGSFTATTADGYLMVYSTSASLTATPANGTIYSIGSTLGNATVIGSGTSTSFALSGLSPSTTYYVSVFAYNTTGCNGGPAYQTTSPLNGNFTTIATPCVAPSNQPTALSFSGTTSSTASGSFAVTTASGYLVLYSTAASLTANPANGTTYTAGNTLGNATVVSSGSTNSFVATGLSASSTYYFYIFSYNNTACSGGPIYNTTAPLSGSAVTLEAPLYYYFGNFHSHSQYSDGSGLPSGDFSFGDTANCMDFLGISEHNHVSAGMSLANYALGRSQAAAASTSSFLAMYGMEWGVISGGGHVVVYGVDKLLGWDAGQYDIYVPQSVYTGSTGLFNVINSYSGSNAFATLAHPNNTDYNGIMSTYDSGADDAVVGSAVENGPSTSTDVTYTDPPSSMLYLSFYRNMLARGYHLGPTIDHDNHNVTHGHTATTRTVVLATALNESSVLSAMRAMRFYATEDCGAYVTFKVNGKPLGTIMTAAGAPVITVTTTTTNPVTSLKIYSGVAGSGSNATILTSTTTGTITYTHTALANGTSRYYYIDITESDGKRTVTAPIWYTRNDAAKMSVKGTVGEFIAIPQPKKVVLKWMTTNEAEGQTFIVERSNDNVHFDQITSLNGQGITTANHNYTTIDETSATGIVYYRLTQTDAAGTIIYSDTQKVNRMIEPKFQVSVFPNPIADNANLKIENAQGENIEVKLYNLSGQLVYRQSFVTQIGDQEIALPTAPLAHGIYFISAQSDTYTVTTKITKL